MATMPCSRHPDARHAEIDKYVAAYQHPAYRMGDQRREAAERTLRELPWRGSYLDVSCGRGEMLRYAESIGFEQIAGTEAVTELVGGNVVQAMAWALPFPDGAFEVVSMLDVIEHLLPGDDELACRELARVASRAILLTANNLSSHPKDDPSIELHVNRRPYEVWHKLFSAWFPGEVRWLHDRVGGRSEMWRIDLA